MALGIRVYCKSGVLISGYSVFYYHLSVARSDGIGLQEIQLN